MYTRSASRGWMLAALCLLSACSGKNKEVLWDTYQEPVTPVELPEPVGLDELDVLWKKGIGGGAEKGYALLQPAYGDGSIFVASRNGDVYSLDAASGKTLWRQKLDGSVFSGVGTDGDIVAIARDDGKVVALDGADGRQLWESAVNRQVSAVPSIGKGRVIIRTADGLLIGLDSITGDTEWTIERTVPGLSIHGDSTPVISGDAVLAGLANGKLVANNVVNGREYWETELSFARGQNELERLTDADAQPLVAGNTVFTATYQDTVAALELQNAAVIWKARVASRLPMALQDDVLFVTDIRGHVVAIDARSGDLLWTQDALQGRGISRPLAIDGRVLVGDGDGNVHSLDAASGRLLESRDVVGGAVVTLVEGSGQFAVFSSEGNLSVVSLQRSPDS